MSIVFAAGLMAAICPTPLLAGVANQTTQTGETSGTIMLAASFRHCDAKAKANIREAVAFMAANKRALKHDFKLAKRRGKRRRIRRRFDRKLHSIRWSCAERVLCRNSAPRVALHAGGIATRKIRVCYDKMVRQNYDFCSFVEIIAHEFGHAIGIKKKRLARHHSQRNDRVYKFGWFARDLCRKQGRSRPLE